MRSRDGVSEPTVRWWQEGELSTVNWAVIDCFLPHNRYHRPANYTPDQQRLFVMQIQEFLCTVSGCSSNGSLFHGVDKSMSLHCSSGHWTVGQLAAAPPGSNHISFIWRAAAVFANSRLFHQNIWPELFTNVPSQMILFILSIDDLIYWLCGQKFSVLGKQ